MCAHPKLNLSCREVITPTAMNTIPAGMNITPMEQEYVLSWALYEQLTSSLPLPSGPGGDAKVYTVELFPGRALSSVDLYRIGRKADVTGEVRGREPNLNNMVNYMFWKFDHCQFQIPGLPAPVRSRVQHSNIVNTRAWILGIVRAELDYHVRGVSAPAANDMDRYLYSSSQYMSPGGMMSIWATREDVDADLARVEARRAGKKHGRNRCPQRPGAPGADTANQRSRCHTTGSGR